MVASAHPATRTIAPHTTKPPSTHAAVSAGAVSVAALSTFGSSGGTATTVLVGRYRLVEWIATPAISIAVAAIAAASSVLSQAVVRATAA